jgi:hypothetical protein
MRLDGNNIRLSFPCKSYWGKISWLTCVTVNKDPKMPLCYVTHTFPILCTSHSAMSPLNSYHPVIFTHILKYVSSSTKTSASLLRLFTYPQCKKRQWKHYNNEILETLIKFFLMGKRIQWAGGAEEFRHPIGHVRTAMGWTVRDGSNPVGVRDFLFSTPVRNGP